MTITQVAETYRTGKHEPNHPSYAAFIRDTIKQWEDLLADGWVFTQSETIPYSDSASMFQDMERKRLAVYTGDQRFATEHPLKYQYQDSAFTLNEVFRAVHDVLGHGPTQCPFETFEGEIEAVKNHQKRYSREAWPALMGETYGQLCHYYAGYGFVNIQCAVVLPEIAWPE